MSSKYHLQLKPTDVAIVTILSATTGLMAAISLTASFYYQTEEEKKSGLSRFTTASSGSGTVLFWTGIVLGLLALAIALGGNYYMGAPE
jgi:heme A synthase